MEAASSIVGLYRLLVYTQTVVDTGEVFYEASGKKAAGYIHYTGDGRMLVLMVLNKDERPRPENPFLATDEQASGLFRTTTAYAGAYEFDGHTVQHHIDISWNETWSGTTQVRSVQKDGDKFVLTSPPFPSPQDGRMNVATIVWERVS